MARASIFVVAMGFAATLGLAGCGPSGSSDKITLPNRSGYGGKTTVPSVIGQSLERAKKTLEDKQLITSIDSLPIDESKCRVTRQDPSSGRVDTLTVVSLKCVIQVPDVVGRSPDEADSALSDAGLKSDQANPPSDGDTSRCSVARQSPTMTAEPHTKISLTLKC